MNIHELAIAKHTADVTYHEGFRAYMDDLDCLNDDRFWDILNKFRSLLNRKRLSTTLAVDELFRLANETDLVAQAEEYQERGIDVGDNNYSTLETIRFAKTYRVKAAALYKPLFDVIEGRGDDSYGDLLDNLPLMGQDMYKQLIGNGEKSNYGNHSVFESAVKDVILLEDFGSDTDKALAWDTLATELTPVDAEDTVVVKNRMRKHVLQGENYNGLRLAEQAERRFIFYCINVERVS
jgi:hypothetical protein